MKSEVRKSVGWWKDLGTQQSDPFMKFFMFYICLDAWMTSASGEDRDDKKLEWLINTDNPLKEHWAGISSGSGFQSWLNGLHKIGRVEDMRPRHRGEYVELSDINDFEQLMRFIYQIRCNLFHGGKSPVNANDTRLVTLSAKILERWIEWTYTKTRETDS